LQIGAIYCALIWAAVLAETLFAQARFPIAPMAATVLVPVLLISLVIYRYPHLWAGFLEHARQTPSFTGLRRPLLGEVLKVIRTVPAIIAVVILLPFSLTANRNLPAALSNRAVLLTLAAGLAAVA